MSVRKSAANCCVARHRRGGRKFGRTKLVDPSVRVPEAVTDMAWRLAASLTRDEALGIHLAESLPRGALDLIEYALR